jgi:DNA-binding SARP family transcriptional activator/tetratricopeptide (TPR) repeat protein
VVGIGVLGPVVVVDADGAEVKLGGVRPRAILAYLAMQPGRDVAVASLIDAVWGDEAPDTVVNTLQVNVSTLRRLLAPLGVSIDRTTGAYRLSVHPTLVDVHQFDGLIAAGRAALRGHHPERGFDALRAGMALWRGRPFEGLEAAPFVESMRPVLERTRTAAAPEQVECLQQLGRFDDAVVEAERIVAREPFDERAWGLVMTSNYLAGHQAEALQAFQRARRVLADELGLEPGPDLVAVERAVLDRSLTAPRRAVEASVTRIDPAPLPAERALVGRSRLIDQVVQALETGDRLVSLVGLGGIGKTSVAIAVAHRFADLGRTVWFVDVSSATGASEAAQVIGRAVGGDVTHEPIGSLAAWATTAEGLLVLDNLEQVADLQQLITAVHPASAGLRVLVTTRRATWVRGERVVAVPPLAVDGHNATDGAVALLERRAAEARADLGELDIGVAVELCELAAGVPLAIELAALQLRVLSPEQLLRRLRTVATTMLDWPATGDYPDRQRSLRTVVQSTLGMMPDDAVGVLLRCAIVAGPVSVDLVERCCDAAGVGLLGHLADLIESGLVARVARSDQLVVPIPVRQHVVDGAESSARWRAESDVLAAVRRLLDDADDQWHGPAAGHHRARLVADAAAIEVSLAVLAARRDWPRLAEFAFLLAPYWLQQSRFVDALSTLDALAGADLPPHDALRVRLLRGTFASYISRADTAALLEPALADLPTSTTPDRLVVNAWCCLGAFHAHHHADDEVRRCVVAAGDAAAASGDRDLVALARDFAGYAASYLGDNETAIALTMDAIADARRQGDRHALALLLATAAESLLQADRIDEARALADEAFELARHVELGVATGWVMLMSGAADLAVGRPAAAWGTLIEHLRFVTEHHPDPLIVGDSLAFLAATQAMSGDDESAARTWGASTAIHSDQGVDPHRRRLRVVQRHWGATRERLGASRFDALVLGGCAAVERIIETLLDSQDGRRHQEPL